MRDLGTEHLLQFPVLGIPTRFETNSSTVAELIVQAFGDWQALHERPDLVEARNATVRIVVNDPPDTAYQYRVLPDLRVLITNQGMLVVCDPLRRESIAFVTPAQVMDQATFRYSVIEASTLGILTPMDRQPFHAAAVVRDGVGVLVAGPSGTGKSTLVYALAKAGFELLTDDIVFIQLDPILRVWGLSRFLHLSEDARRFFPELDRCGSILTANGKQKIAIDARSRGFTAALPVAERAILCMLERNSGRARADRVSAHALESELLGNPESGFDLFTDTIRPAIHMLAANGGWRIHLGASPQEVVPLIERIVAG